MVEHKFTHSKFIIIRGHERHITTCMTRRLIMHVRDGGNYRQQGDLL